MSGLSQVDRESAGRRAGEYCVFVAAGVVIIHSGLLFVVGNSVW